MQDRRDETASLKRQFRNRHAQLTAHGGSIGDGRLLESVDVLPLPGPSMVLVHAIASVAAFPHAVSAYVMSLRHVVVCVAHRATGRYRKEVLQNQERVQTAA